MSDTELKIKITASENVSDAVKAVTAALGDSQLGRAITAAGAGMSGLKAGFDLAYSAAIKIGHAFESVVNAGIEADRADRKLVQSLSMVGEYSQEAFNQINQFAEAVEKTTGISDESTKELIGLGMSLGMTADQAQKAAEASMNFASVTGQSTESVMHQLNATLQGTTGRLGLQVGMIGNLSKAQLINGEAIDIMNAKYKDFAKNSAMSLEGSLHHVSVAFGNIIEEAGKFVSQNDLVYESVNILGHGLQAVADGLTVTRDFFQSNSAEIKQWASAAAAVAAVIGTVMVAMNAATIATTGWAVAMKVLTAVMAVNPVILLATAVGVGLVAAFQHFNIGITEVISAIKILIGGALTPLAGAITALMVTVGALVSVFKKDWGNAIINAGNSVIGLTSNLITNGAEQIKASRAAIAHAEAMKETSASTRGLEEQLTIAAQAMNKMEADFARSSKGAKIALDAIKEFTPQIQLNEWKENYSLFQKSLQDLQKTSINIRATIQSQGGPKDEQQAKMLQQAIESESRASQAILALKIKDFQEERNARLKEVDVMTTYEIQKATSVSDEIMLKKIAAAEQIRQKEIEIESQKIIEAEGIMRHGVDVETQARINARQVDLQSYQEYLNAQMSLAVDMELQKQQALAAAKASAVGGLGGPAEAGAGADVTVLAEQARQEKLKALRNEGLMSQQEYQQAMFQSDVEASQARTNALVAMEQQRSELLGLTDAGVTARLEQQRLENSMKQEELTLAYQNQLVTQQEYQAAILEQQYAHESAMAEVKYQAAQQESQLAAQQGDLWRKTLADIQAEQARHGVIMGTIRGVQNSDQMQAMQTTMSQMSSMMQTGNKQQFEIGKGAAIAQASINTFMAATGAMASLASIPIVGPALGIAAAAMITMAGMARVSQIQSQQFKGGGQADEGMTQIPHSLSGRSFVLEGGERVVKTDQNKDLSMALDKINSGDMNQSNNIAINVSGGADKDTVSGIKDAVVDALRDASERGRPILNQRGVVA